MTTRRGERARAKGGDLFVCPISNGQSGPARASISSALYASDTVYGCIHAHAGPPLSCILFALGYTLASRGMPLGRICKGRVGGGGIEEAVVKPMAKGSVQFSPCCSSSMRFCSHSFCRKMSGIEYAQLSVILVLIWCQL